MVRQARERAEAKHKELLLLHALPEFSQQPYAVGTIIIPLLQMGMLRPSEVKQHPQVTQLVSGTAWIPNPGPGS